MLEPSGAYKLPTYLELFCGIGGFALGFNAEGFQCRGAIDYDPLCCDDHETLTGFRPMTANIAGLTPEDLLRYAGMEAPDVVCLSPPCQGFSGCLPRVMAKKDRYKALNSLSWFGIWLVLNAWTERPPPLIVMENVPRAAKSAWMDDVVQLLEEHGYKVVRHSHNCAEIGPLAQNRRRMLLLARHRGQVLDSAPVLLPPAQTPLTVGQVLSKLPVPSPRPPRPPRPPRVKGQPRAPRPPRLPRTMHDLPELSALNWLRLASIPAGKDHHQIPRLIAQSEGVLGVGLDCEPRAGVFGVQAWDSQAPTIIASADIHAGAFACQDPRLDYESRRGTMGVVDPDGQANTVIGATTPHKGAAVVDARIAYGETSQGRYPHGWGVLASDRPSFTIKAKHDTQIAFASVQDARLAARNTRYNGYFGVNPWEGGAHTVVAANTVKDTWASTTDPRLATTGTRHNGHYGINDWNGQAHTVIADNAIRNTWGATADPEREGWPVPTHELRQPQDPSGERVTLPILYGPALDLESQRPLYLVIRAVDGSWHRPLTPTELFVLQGFEPYDKDGQLVRLAGDNSQRWKKAIGNAVPPPAAAAIARTCKRTIMAARGGGLMFFSPGEAVWVDKHPEQQEKSGRQAGQQAGQISLSHEEAAS